MMRARAGRPGPALAALAAILVITAAWWALALWPAGASAPEWLARTRGACFGAMPGGLPDAGGWILLIGEPIGMLGVMLAVWGDSLIADFRALRAHPAWRLVGGATLAVVVAGLGSSLVRVARATALRATPAASASGVPVRLDAGVPPVALIDQRGQRVALAELRGPALVAFAFGHCEAVCPTVVHDLRAARRTAARPDVPIVVVTLDPWRDTPERLATIAAHWELARDDRVLSGSVEQVERALDAFGIARTRDERTGDIAHLATVLVVDRGRIAWRVDGGASRVAELLAAGGSAP